MRKAGRVAMATALAVTAGAGFPRGPVVGQAAQQAVAHVLYSFGGPDGAGPLSGVTPGPGGVLYGDTVFGGKKELGTVFTLTPKASGGYTERVVFSFTGRDGSKPGGNVVMDSKGDLFGETVIGGTHGDGTVFELVPSGLGAGYTEEVLYSFTGALDGNQPLGSLVLDASGDLFGVTQFGGTGSQGVIFEFKPTGAGYTEDVLHSFSSGGGQPQAGLTRAGNGTLYGTLYGASAVNPGGTVFSLRLPKAGPVYHVLHVFHGGSDGENPFAALTVDSNSGVVYGSTQNGGTNGGLGSGTVFSLTPSGTGYTERVLHSFAGSRDGLQPEAPLLLTAGGDLYGTTTLAGEKCGGTGCGTVFELIPGAAGSYTFRLVHQFTGPPGGADPEWSPLAPGPGGLLYGTTRSGGTATGCADGGPGGVLGCGTVYTIKP